MICKKCGLETFENSVNCINCGIPVADVKALSDKQKSVNGGKLDLNPHIVKSIIVTLILPTPVAFIAIFYSVLAINALSNKQLDKADKYCKRAKQLSSLGIIVGVGIIFTLAVIALILKGFMWIAAAGVSV